MKFRNAIPGVTLLVSVIFATAPTSADPLDDLLYPADANGVLPIERILNQARNSVQGTILEVELEHESGRLFYEVEILTMDNKKIEIDYDAKTGVEISRKEKTKRGKNED